MGDIGDRDFVVLSHNQVQRSKEKLLLR
jgi:hypothetical protein